MPFGKARAMGAFYQVTGADEAQDLGGKMTRISLWLIAFLCILATIGLNAQTTTGTILGQVSDPQGAAIPNVLVTVTNTLTGETHSITADAQGSYVIPHLPVGVYRVETLTAGFKRSVQDGVTLTVNEDKRVDLALQIGSTSQSVEVHADTTEVNTYTPELGNVIGTQTVTDLPLNGRNVYNLLVSLPGVSTINAEVVPSRNNSTFVVNGGRGTSNSCFVDGGFNNDIWRNQCSTPPNPDAIQEVQLLSSSSDVEFGRLPGSFMNMITKSGTNSYHGSAYDYLRNNDLDAIPDFLTSVPVLKQNQFGFSIGGPALPALKNKVLLFGSWEELKIKQSQYIYSVGVPTAAEKTGNFSSASDAGLFSSSWLANPVAPTPVTSSSTSVSLAPISSFSLAHLPTNPVAVAIANDIPLGNNPDGTLTVGAGAPDNVWQYLLKGDYLETSKQKWSASWFQVHSVQTNPFPDWPWGGGLPGFGGRQDGAFQHNLVVNHTWTPTSNFINEARFNLFHRDTPWQITSGKTLESYGMNFVQGAVTDGDDANPVGPRMFITGRFDAGAWDANGHDHTIGGSDTVMWIKGRHNLKLGSFVMWGYYAENGASAGGGQIDDTGNLSGNPMADFMMGYMSDFPEDSGDHPDESTKYWHSYAQDTWKIAPRLTLTYGLRYEVTTPLVWTVNYVSSFKEGQQSTVYPTAPKGLLFYGDQGVYRAGRQSDNMNFAPRLGLAFDPFGDGKTSVRAGYGVYFESAYGDGLRAPQPFVLSVDVTPALSMSNPWLSFTNGTNPFPFTPPKAGATNYTFTLPQSPIVFATAGANVDGHAIKPATRPWINQLDLSVQRDLARGMTLQVAYVGTISRKLTDNVDQNYPIYETDPITNQPASASNFNDRRPYMPSAFTAVGTYETGYNGSYNALQVALTQNTRHGLNFNANYTWAKGLDLVSSDNYNGGLGFTSSLNPGLDKGPSDGLAKSILNFSGTYQVPKFQNLGNVANALVSGWEANTIFRLHSGTPVNVTSDVDTNMDGVSGDRPNRTAGKSLYTSGSRAQRIQQWFNPAAFQAAPAGQNGNLERNFLTGPRFVNADVSFFKVFPIYEEHKIQFRAELFDAFNHGNLNNPVSDLLNPNVGQIQSAVAARVVQFGLHYSF